MGLGKYDRFTLVGRLFHLCRTHVPLKSYACSAIIVQPLVNGGLKLNLTKNHETTSKQIRKSIIKLLQQSSNTTALLLSAENNKS